MALEFSSIIYGLCVHGFLDHVHSEGGSLGPLGFAQRLPKPKERNVFNAPACWDNTGSQRLAAVKTSLRHGLSFYRIDLFSRLENNFVIQGTLNALWP